MPRYDVRLHRKQVDYRLVSVQADDPEKARERALALARGDATPGPDEDEGDWCDGDVGRAVVDAVERDRSGECPHGWQLGQLCSKCGRRVQHEDLGRQRPD